MVRRRDYLSTITAGVLFGSTAGLMPSRARGAPQPSAPANHDSYPHRRDADRVQFVEADPDFGFNYPYWLATPADYRAGPIPLMVEMNNARKGQDLGTLKDRVRDQITRFGLQGPWLSEELGVPQLIPVVPRPDGDPVDASHNPTQLNREAMLLERTDLERVDLQLLRMAAHASQQVLSDLDLHDKVIIYGNSSGGVVGERMAAMHPESVLAVAAGGLNGFVLLPFEQLGDLTLPYPVGVGDFESVVGKSYDAAAHDAVDMFYFHGAEDEKNRLHRAGESGDPDDWSDPEVLRTARAVYGPDMVNDRFPRCHIAFETAGVDAQFRIYEGMGHNPGPASHDILEFLRRSIDGEDVSAFGQRLELPFEREIRVARRSEVEAGIEVEFTVSGTNPPPDGIVSYRWDFGDGSTGTGLSVVTTFEDPGTYDVALTMETVHGQHAERTMQFAYETPVFEVEDADLSTETVGVGESITLTTTVRNTGNQAGTLPLTFSIDGDIVEERSVELDVEEVQTVSFDRSFEEPGTYELAINDQSAGILTVAADPTTGSPASNGTETPTAAETPGFGVLTALAGFASGISYLAYRHRRKDQ